MNEQTIEVFSRIMEVARERTKEYMDELTTPLTPVMRKTLGHAFSTGYTTALTDVIKKRVLI